MTEIIRVSPKELSSDRIFQIIRNINDPEHPKTLEQLDVVQEKLITCEKTKNYVKITFTPTIPHCSMATLIGLCIRVKLERELDKTIKFDVAVTPGTHSQEDQVTKQLRDKERVFAALENTSLMAMVEKCIEVNELNNPVFYNPNASCGNSSGLKPDEQPTPGEDDEEEGGCCGGHGKSRDDGGECCQSSSKDDGDNNNNNNNSNEKKDGCCQNGSSNDKNDSECCNGENKNKDTNDKKNNDKEEDECCGGGNGNNGEGCCQSKS